MKVNKWFIMLAVVLVGLLVYAFSSNKELRQDLKQIKYEQVQLKLSISKYYNMVRMLEDENERLAARSIYYENKADSLKKINNEIPDPKIEPIPLPNARNDSIRKWAKDFR